MKFNIGFLKMVSNSCKIQVEAPEGTKLESIDSFCNRLQRCTSYEEFMLTIAKSGYRLVNMAKAPEEEEFIVDELEEIEEETL